MDILRPYDPPFDYLNELVENLVTEDDEPVDMFASRNHTLLVSPLYDSWTPPLDPETGRPRKFLACSNVGVFPGVRQPPLVPDMFLSMDVEIEGSLHDKRNAAYFLWEFGKAPDVVIEIVVDRKGEELGRLMRGYARIGTPFYVVYDPSRYLSDQPLRVYGLHGGRYQCFSEQVLPGIGLGLTVWEGEYHFLRAPWLRWCDEDQRVIPTGEERAEAIRLRRAQ